MEAENDGKIRFNTGSLIFLAVGLIIEVVMRLIGEGDDDERSFFERLFHG